MKKSVIGILAHVDAGKTTLSENILLHTGAIRQAGRVDRGDTHLDTQSVEIERGITVYSKTARLLYRDFEMTLVDTPGHVDFAAEMERVLPVLDYAVLLINGAEGVTGHTRTLWRLLSDYRIPAFIFVNKMDRPGLSKESILADIRRELAPDILDYSCGRTEEFYEELSMCDDALMEEYLALGRISDAATSDAVKRRRLFLCLFGSALKDEGVTDLLDMLCEYTKNTVYPDEFGARVFGITRDARNERLVWAKITGGSIGVKQTVGEDKIDGIRIYSADRYENVERAEAGTICAFLGLDGVRAGDTLGAEKGTYTPELMPVISYSIILPPDINTNDAYAKLCQLSEESPELSIAMEEDDSLSVKVMGSVQKEILARLALDRFGIPIDFGAERIVYKETLDDTVIGVGHFEPLRHYAEVQLRIEPAKRGSGLCFECECSQDVLAPNWQRLIMTHLRERRHKGTLTGAEFTDARITLLCGRAHQKHTGGGDFRQAAYRAVRQGLMQAHMRLLEPVYSYVLDIPEQCLGRALSDLSGMNSVFSQPDIRNGIATVRGTAPVTVMSSYAEDVAAYTKGMGSLSYMPGGYDYCHNEQEVIDAFGYEPTADVRHTPDSVFCQNGSGFVVPWNEVFDYMHTELDGKAQEELRPMSMLDRLDTAMGVEEIDEIIRKMGGSNRNESKPAREYSFEPKKEVVYKPVKKKEKYYLIDAYNVIFAWEELSNLAAENVTAARDRLLDVMCDYAAISGVNMIVVFDAYRVKEHKTEIFDYHNIHVVYTKESQTADRYIEEFAHTNASRYDITVVTSDGLEQIIIRGEGCNLISSREFEGIVSESRAHIMRRYDDMNDSDEKIYLAEFLPNDLTNE